MLNKNGVTDNSGWKFRTKIGSSDNLFFYSISGSNFGP